MSLRRRKPLAQGKPLERRTRLRQVSKKRKAQQAARADVRAQALARARYQCEMAARIPELGCWGPLDVDEIQPRGRGGDYLDLDNCQVGCRRHHDWKHDNPAEAMRRGLTRSGFRG